MNAYTKVKVLITMALSVQCILAADSGNSASNLVQNNENAERAGTEKVEQTESKLNKPQNLVTGSSVYDVLIYSVNMGGGVNGSSSNFRLSGSVGQVATGTGGSTNFIISDGFWYNIGPSGCLSIPGDVNHNGVITIGDIVHLVNFIFDKDRLPCTGISPGNCWQPYPYCNGDVNNTGRITIGDIVYLINYIFDKDRLPCVGIDPGNCWMPEPSGSCCLPVQ